MASSDSKDEKTVAPIETETMEDKCDKDRGDSEETNPSNPPPKLLAEELLECSKSGLASIKEVRWKPKDLKERLHKEIQKAERYDLVNDAKLRALTQGTSTYDEFRQIWMSAHMKPMEKKDKLDAFQAGAKVVWNSVANKEDAQKDDKNAKEDS